MNEIIEKEIKIENMIYEIDGLEVMLDSDLAKLYNVGTKRINEAVHRNKEKFPLRISWIISENQFQNLRSQIATSSSNNNYGGRRYNPRVFTEQGVYMLATVLKSKEAINVSIRIMDTFVKMRHYINYTKSFLPYKFLLLEDKVDNNTKRIDELFDKFSPEDIVKDYIFFETDFYDAYSVVLDILNRAKEEIIIIDNYAGKELLDMIKQINKKITIVSKNIDDYLVKKYKMQYSNIAFVTNDKFHDRFIILDRKELYLCGSSLKDVGKKCFGISKMNDKMPLEIILDKLELN